MAGQRLERFHRGMKVVYLGFVVFPNVRLVSVSAPVVFSTLRPAVKNRLVLSLVIGTTECKGVLAPSPTVLLNV